jgi:adenine-specific DNA glycosylase
MTGLKAHVVHLYPRWVLSWGNGTLICTSRQPLKSFCPISLAMIFIYFKDFKALKNTGIGALASQRQHMAAQKGRFTPWPIRYGLHYLQILSSAALESAY